MLAGVRFFGEGSRTQSLVMTLASRKVRFVDTIHLEVPPGPRGVRVL
jgi:fructose-1,6-bisphosphatase/sedoheptulose 1,7-bisphosphatase-like protein